MLLLAQHHPLAPAIVEAAAQLHHAAYHHPEGVADGQEAAGVLAGHLREAESGRAAPAPGVVAQYVVVGQEGRQDGQRARGGGNAAVDEEAAGAAAEAVGRGQDADHDGRAGGAPLDEHGREAGDDELPPHSARHVSPVGVAMR